MHILHSESLSSSTKTVERVAKELHCSTSAVWNNFNQLKKIGLIIATELGAGLSEIGLFVASGLEVRK